MAKKQIEFDYFHDYESEQFAFYRIPKVLFTDDCFKSLSSDAKVLYGLMLDRMALSIRNQWVDDEGKVYIIFTLEQVMQYMNCGKDKGVKIMAELDTEKGIGLIQRVKRGLGKPTIIYVKSFIIREKTERIESRSSEVGNAEVKTSEKPKSGVLENRSPEVGKTEVRTSEKSKSEVLENRSLEVGKTDSNYTYNNNTDFSNTESINLSVNCSQKAEDVMDRMDEVQIYTNLVKANIEYDIKKQSMSSEDQKYVDEIVELMVETLCIKKDSILIAGAEYPCQLVKSKLLKIDSSHIEYILWSLKKNTTKIRNIKAYLLTCIFNAPSTMHNFYQAEVNHDLYGVGV